MEYISSKASHYGDLNFNSATERDAMHTTLQSNLVIRYNPAMHAESYIIYTDLEDVYVGIGFGFVVILLGLGIFFGKNEEPGYPKKWGYG